MNAKRKSRSKRPAPPTKQVSWRREWPKELFIPMSPPRKLVNPLIDLGEDAPRGAAHDAYWDWVDQERFRISCVLFDFLRERGWIGLTPDARNADWRWPDDVPETKWRWPELTLALAEAAFPALQDPRPWRPGKANRELDALDKLAAVHRSSSTLITSKAAYEAAGISRSLFFAAKQKYVKVGGADWWRTWQRPPYK